MKHLLRVWVKISILNLDRHQDCNGKEQVVGVQVNGTVQDNARFFAKAQDDCISGTCIIKVESKEQPYLKLVNLSECDGSLKLKSLPKHAANVSITITLLD